MLSHFWEQGHAESHIGARACSRKQFSSGLLSIHGQLIGCSTRKHGRWFLLDRTPISCSSFFHEHTRSPARHLLDVALSPINAEFYYSRISAKYNVQSRLLHLALVHRLGFQHPSERVVVGRKKVALLDALFYATRCFNSLIFRGSGRSTTKITALMNRFG